MTIFLIYAAGDSSRIKKDFKIEHKGLLQINNKTLIDHQLDWINNYNPKKIIIVANHNHTEFLKNIDLRKKNLPIKLIYNDDIKSKNMKSFYLAKNEIINNDIVFTTSDLYCDIENINTFMEDKFPNKILTDFNTNNFSGDEVLISESKNIVTRCSKKIDKFNGIAIGVYKFNKEFISKMIDYCNNNNSNGYFDKSLYHAIDNVIIDNFKTKPIEVKNPIWFDIDTFDEYVNAKKILLKNEYKKEI